MTSGWNAEGLIEIAWKRLDPPTRDHLAELTGIDKNLLSRYNGGQPLGLRNAERIAAATGLSVFDLGAPEEVVPAEHYRSVLDRLRSLEDALDALGPKLAELQDVPERVLALERQAQPRRQRGAGS